MSRPVILSVTPRPHGKCDFIVSAGEPGRERVRVVRSHGRYACMTHNSADVCEHARAARGHDAADAAPALALDDARPARRRTSMDPGSEHA